MDFIFRMENQSFQSHQLTFINLYSYVMFCSIILTAFFKTFLLTEAWSNSPCDVYEYSSICVKNSNVRKSIFFSLHIKHNIKETETCSILPVAMLFHKLLLYKHFVLWGWHEQSSMHSLKQIRLNLEPLKNKECEFSLLWEDIFVSQV